MTAALWIIRASAWLVPADVRAEWRREWLAEANVLDGAGVAAILRFAAGAPVHALWMRGQSWRPGPVAADVRFALRWFVRRPMFSLAAVGTLALGIAATTGTFGILDGVVLKPLPYRDPARIVQLWEINPLFHWTEATVAPGNLLSWRDRCRSFEDIAWYSGSATRDGGVASVTLEGAEPIRVRALPVSAHFFDVLGVRAAWGRTFAPDEDVPGRHKVMVLSDGFWRAHFGGDPSVIGTTVRVNSVPLQIIGVMPASFEFDNAPTDVWLPLAMNQAQMREVRVPHLFRTIARLKPGVSMAEAGDDLRRVARELEQEHPDSNKQMSAGLGPIDDWFVGPLRRPLVLFFVAVSLLLLIACSNVANLLLLRTQERLREMSVRAALGASRSRLVRQLLAESLALAGLGTALGLVLAAAGIRAFVHFAPVGLPRLHEAGLNGAVSCFAAGLVAVTTLLVGLAPAMQGAQVDLRSSLGSGARTTPSRLQMMRRVLVAGEVALAVVLLVGSLLTIRNFRALMSADPGFQTSGLVTADVFLPGVRYGSGKYAMFFQTALDRLRSTPGIVDAGATAKLPLEGPAWSGALYIEGQPDVRSHELRHKSVTSGYLETLGLRLERGRTISSDDGPDAPLVVVVNHALAQSFFAGENPVGRRISFDAPAPKVKWRTIVGVVSDEAQDGLGRPAVPEVYDSEQQEEFNVMAIAVRSRLTVEQTIQDIRTVVHALDPLLAVYDVGAFDDRLSDSVAGERASAAIVSVFALCALVLSAVGVFGVAAYAVSARVREIGIRVAFGASAGDVLGFVVRREVLSVAVGAAVGLGASLALGRLLDAMLFGVTSHDAVSYAGGAVILLVVGATACLVPATRALRIDPVEALRTE